MGVTRPHESRVRPGPRRCRALTLIEATIALLVTAVMLVAALNMVGSAARARTIQAGQDLSGALASDLMSEILCSAYEEVDGSGVWGRDASETGDTRSAYDDVDDYDGWSASPPESKGGSVIDGYTGWTRQVQVRFASPTNPGADAGYDSGLKRVRVTVTSDTGKTTTLFALRARSGAYTALDEASASLIGSVQIDLQVGSEAAPIVSGVSLLNDVPGQPTVDGAANSPPQAVAEAFPETGLAPLIVSFSGHASSDADGDDLVFAWEFGDGNSGTGESVTHTYWGPASYTATLTVTDVHGASDTATVTVNCVISLN
jgi:hypothetical protein